MRAETGGLCVEQIGRKDVTVLSAGNAKLRITVMLTARSDGMREKPTPATSPWSVAAKRTLTRASTKLESKKARLILSSHRES
ncbi:hypothetical protein AAVH_30659 [Aphelenchoides avenae]|nr:hypothetical protein AAVH_30659 [Aphelenchus avenae]